jgi:hypothetical protein
MHIDVSARPNTRYTIEAIMYIGCCKYMEQNITVCLSVEIVFLNMRRSGHSVQLAIWEHLTANVL